MEFINAPFFEFLGPCVDQVLADYNESQDKLCAQPIIRMSTQLLEAVKFIHSFGMCHGDESIVLAVFCLLNSNIYVFDVRHQRSQHRILLHISANKAEEELFEFLGFPEIEPLSRLDGTPLETGLPNQPVKAAE
jgi:hypothetical protein